MFLKEVWKEHNNVNLAGTPIPPQSYRLIIVPVGNYRLLCAISSHLENNALKKIY